MYIAFNGQLPLKERNANFVCFLKLIFFVKEHYDFKE